MVQVVSGVQVDSFGLLVDGHDSQADIQRAVKFPSLNLECSDLLHSNCSC